MYIWLLIHCLMCVCQVHYYQPMLTMVGVGMRSLSQMHRPMRDVLPSDCDWIQDSAASFDPDGNQLTTRTGTVVRHCISSVEK